MAPLLLPAVAWLAGLWLAAQLSQPAWAWLLLAGLAAASLVLLRDKTQWRRLLFLGVMLGLAAARFEAARPPWHNPAFVGNLVAAGGAAAPMALDAWVSAEPEVRDTYARLRVESIAYTPAGEPSRPARGAVVVYAPKYSASRQAATGDAAWHYGDRVRAWGRLEAPPEFDGFSYAAVLAQSGIYAQVAATHVAWRGEAEGSPAWAALLGFKARARQVLAHSFPEPQAGFLTGLLLGDGGAIGPGLEAALAATGTTHIIAISGFNIAILAGLLTAITHRWLGARRGLLPVLLAVAGYTLLVGATASVVRAAIMSSLALVAGRLGRRTDGLNALAASALVMTAIDPHWLWDVGFQLSALATLGLVLYAQPIQTVFEQLATRRLGSARARRLTLLIADSVLVSLAAQITTLPLTLLYFERLSLASLLANALVLPAQPAVMVSGGLALLLGLVWAPLGQLAAVAAWPVVAYTLALVEWLGRLPWASFYLGEVSPAVALTIYALLLGFYWLRTRPGGAPPAGAAATGAYSPWPGRGLAILGGGALLVWGWYFSLPAEPARLRITLLEVPAGEAVLVSPPGGSAVLIGGGPGGHTLARALADHLPLLVTDLDTLVVAAPGDDHLGGLPALLDRFHFRQAVITEASGRSAARGTLLSRLNQAGVTLVSATEHPVLDLGRDITLRVLADTPQGSVWRLEWERFSLLLAPGLDADSQVGLLRQGLIQPATALLLAESGAAGANSPTWLAAVDPQVALISVEAGNPAGDPAPEVLASLAGRNVLRTDRHGAITLETDGQQLWVEVER